MIARIKRTTTESLDHGNGARTTIRDAAVARASAQETKYRTEKHGDDRAAQIVVPGQLVTKPVRQTEHPLNPSAAAALGTPALPYRHVSEHVIDQVRKQHRLCYRRLVQRRRLP